MDEISEKNTGILYIVATPIGNLEDISLRALRILKEVDFIAAEDTRHTKKLLNAYNITTRLISLHEHSEKEKNGRIVEQIKSGLSAAYVSDAGTPCISDPGYYLISLARQEKIKVVPVPGPSAVIAALCASGFSGDEFVFCGFLPSKKNQRRLYLEALRHEERTIVFYESPLRCLAALQDVYEILGNREAVIGRELTKVFEEIKKGNIGEFIGGSDNLKARGEFTIILQGAIKKEMTQSDADIEQKLSNCLEDKKMSRRDAVAFVAGQTGINRNRIYNLAIKLRTNKP